jgi:hypothetical protein
MEENKEVGKKPALTSDWRAPAFYYPGISRIEWLAGMIASGLASNPVAVQPDQGLTQAHARAIVVSALELAKALDEVEAG